MKQIKTILKQLSSEITDEDLNPLVQKWIHKKTLKRFEHLSVQGKVENMLYFINKGIFRTYITTNEVEEDELFAYSGSFYCSYISFLNQLPAQNNLQALAKAEVIGIKRDDFYSIIEKNQKLERLWRQQTERLLIQRVERALLLRTSSIEKVKSLLEKNPEIFQLLPHKYIASYLHMSPATLSRVLKKL